MKKLAGVLALLLAMSLLLSGCGLEAESWEVTQLRRYYEEMCTVDYADMEYERPSMTNFQQSLDHACQTALEAQSVDRIIDAIYSFYDEYDWFYTNYMLADIRYSTNLTDLYWEQEYNYCAEQAATVDAGLDTLYRTLAKSPLRAELEAEEYFGAGYFDYYEGESLYDEYFLDLMDQEADLISQYYDLSNQALEAADAEEYYGVYGEQMAQVLVELVVLRQEIAWYAGYEDYTQFAYDWYYYRDYTPTQVNGYLEEIREDLVPLYRATVNTTVWEAGYEYCTQREAYAYVESCAKNMGGVVRAAFDLMDQRGLCDIEYGENKYSASFEVFLTSYSAPFILMNPYQSSWDKLTFVHEFGHFANDYACVGSYAGTDVAEVFSQAMEYLSLRYADGGEELTDLKMMDSLCIYVEQAAYADFERQLYDLVDPTVEDVEALYDRVCREYGFDTWDFDSRSFVDVTHFYTNPMYIISYVVSNDVAFQIYQMELAEEGAGLALLQENLFSSESWLLAFAESCGLESPMAQGRVAQVRQTMEEILK